MKNAVFSKKIKMVAGALSIALVIALCPSSIGIAADAQEKTIICELKELRNEYAKTYLQSDGTYISTISAEPQHYLRDETWEDIDNTLNKETDAQGGTFYQNKANAYRASLPDSLTEPVTLQKDGHKLSIRLLDAQKKKLKKKSQKTKNSGNKLEQKIKPKSKTAGAEYIGALDDTDVVYDVEPGALKESIILNKKPCSQTTYTYEIDAHGLSVVLNSDNSVYFFTENSEQPLYTMPAPFLFDSAEAAVYSHDVTVSLEDKKNGTYLLKYTPDFNWLRDAERVYPVILDPSINVASTFIMDADIYSGAPEMSGGQHTTGSIGTNQSGEIDYAYFLKFNYLSIPNGSIVNKAMLSLTNTGIGEGQVVAVSKVTSEWSENVTWNTKPNMDGNVLDYQTVEDITQFDITSIAQDWTRTYNNYGVAFHLLSGGGYVVFNSADASTGKPYITLEYSLPTPCSSLHSISAGRAGTVTLIDATGKLNIVAEDIGFDGLRMPVTIQRIFSMTQNGASGMSAYWRTNYHQSITYNSELNRYQFINECGDTIYLEPDTAVETEVSAWKDENGQGYALQNSGTSFSSYEEIRLTGPDGYARRFNAAGRLVSITDENQPVPSAITITYRTDDQALISMVTDGAGRKYRFDYTEYQLSGYTKKLLTGISYLGDSESTIFQSVAYTYDSTQDFSLQKVDYQDDQTVTYHYRDMHFVDELIDTDGKKIKLTYSLTHTPWDKITKIEEFGTDGTGGDALTLTYGARQTTIMDSRGNQQVYQFNEEGTLTSVRDQNGDTVEAAYGGDQGQLLGIGRPVVEPVGDNLAIGEFVYSPDASVRFPETYTGSISSLSGKSCDRVIVSYNSGTTGIQTVNSTFDEGDVYTFGGWLMGTVMSEAEAGERAVKLEVVATKSGEATPTTIAQLDYNRYLEDWQYVSEDFTMPFSCDQVTLKISVVNQPNQLRFSQISLQKTFSAQGLGLTEVSTVSASEQPTSDSNIIKDQYGRTIQSGTLSEGTVTNLIYDDYGNIVKAVETDGKSEIITANSYTEQGNKFSTSTDELGNTTTYGNSVVDISGITGITRPNGSITAYQYNAKGDLTQIRTPVTNLLGGSALEYNVSYTNGKISQTYGADSGYFFDYTPFGDITAIRTYNRPLATYSYVSNNNRLISSITGTNSSIYYTYDSKNQLTGIRYGGDAQNRFSYEYNKYGTCVKKQDTVNYLTTTYQNGIVEERDSSTDDLIHSYEFRENSLREQVGNVVVNTDCAYSSDNRLLSTTFKMNDALFLQMENQYDSFGRLTGSGSFRPDNTYRLWDAYTYRQLPGNRTTRQVESVITHYADSIDLTSYTYDTNGYLKTISKNGEEQRRYHYDEAGQLVRVDDKIQNKTFVYQYDTNGNIRTREDYAYTAGGALPGSSMTGAAYTYSDSFWLDMLTEYNNKPIVYSGGNPISYDGWTFEWENGRQLKSMSKNGTNIAYQYNDEGRRMSKTVNGIKTTYTVVDGRMTHESRNNGTQDVFYQYDGRGNLVSMRDSDGKVYVYVKDIQDSIIGLVDENGALVVNYTYDAWGEVLSVTGSKADTLGESNPFRYRGYYYDTETGYYYLQSRYYVPEWCRFLNIDDVTMLLDDEENILKNNLFIYARNNPNEYVDYNGNKAANLQKYISIKNEYTAPVRIEINNNNIRIMAYINTKGIAGNKINKTNTKFYTAIKSAIESYWSGSFTVFGYYVNLETDVADVARESLWLRGGQKSININVKNVKKKSDYSYWSNSQFGMWGKGHPGGITLFEGDGRISKDHRYSESEFRFVVAHEFGHVLGLEDNYNKKKDKKVKSIMNEFWTGVQNIDVEKVLLSFSKNKTSKW